MSHKTFKLLSILCVLSLLVSILSVTVAVAAEPQEISLSV